MKVGYVVAAVATDKGEVVETTFPPASTVRKEFTNPFPNLRFATVVEARVEVAFTTTVPVKVAPLRAAYVLVAYVKLGNVPVAYEYVTNVFDAYENVGVLFARA